MCILYGLVVQGGAWFSIIDTETGELLKYDDKDLKFQGKPKLYNFLIENPDFYDKLNNKFNEISNK